MFSRFVLPHLLWLLTSFLVFVCAEEACRFGHIHKSKYTMRAHSPYLLGCFALLSLGQTEHVQPSVEPDGESRTSNISNDARTYKRQECQ